MTRIRCTFRPQAWIGDTAVEVDRRHTDAESSWEMDVDALPETHSYDSDALRESPNAPEWVRDWQGPFEVDYVQVADLDPEVAASVARDHRRRELARTLAADFTGVEGDDFEVHDDAAVESVDGGYWVEARVWVDADLVEAKMEQPS